MKLCEKFNLTYGVEDVNSQGNSEIRFNTVSKRFEGELFRVIVEKFFLRDSNDNLDGFYKHCNFRMYSKFGSKQDNGSYDGVLGGVISGEIDLSLKPGDFFINENIDFTKHLYDEPYTSFQFVNNNKMQLKEKGIIDVLSIFAPNLIFFLEYLFLFLISSLIGVFFLSLSLKKIFKTRKFINLVIFLSFFRSIKFKKIDYFSIFMLSVLVYKFIIQTLIQNNIKTNKVIIDISDLVTSREKLMFTKKEACFIEDTKTNDFFKFSPNHTLPNFVYTKLSDSSNRCFLLDGIGFNKFKNKLDNYIVFVFKAFMEVCSNIVRNFYQSDIFINDKPYFDVLMTTYIRKSLPKNIKIYIDHCYSNVVEKGFVINLFNYFNTYFAIKFPTKYSGYNSLENYIKQFTYIDDLNFDDFKTIFNLFFIINLIIFFVFLIHYLIRFSSSLLIYFRNLKNKLL